jgi:DNA-binding NtrC family response regulator
MPNKLNAEIEARVLLIDDDTVILNSVRRALSRSGYDVEIAATGTEGLLKVRSFQPDLVLLDVRLPDRDGLDLLEELRAEDASLSVVMITAYASIDVAIRAIRQGAEDFLAKPFKPETLRVTVRNVLSRRVLRERNRQLTRDVQRMFGHGVVFGQSQAIRQLAREVDVAANGDGAVLITGESGTGKEVVARYIHTSSRRSDRPFVAVNCAAIPTHLIESELFGHMKGAFTGATSSRKGIFEQAMGGTVLLDEIGEMSLELQPRLLRVLESQVVNPVGSERGRKVDFRIIAATNHDIASEVEREDFRRDLFYRLSVVQLTLPPLRERTDEIPDLCEVFLERYSKELGRPTAGFTDQAMQLLIEHSWPGNVRELRNVVERAVMFGRANCSLGLDVLPMSLTGNRKNGPRADPSFADLPDDVRAWPDLEEMKERYMREVIRRSGNNRSRAARILGVHPSTLWRRLGGANDTVDHPEA